MSMKPASAHRLQRRLVRRWKRRLRIAAPFLSVPLLLGMLVLSVDLIEYRPEEPPQRRVDRPSQPEPESERTKDRTDGRSGSTAGVIQRERNPLGQSPRISATALELDLDLQLPELELSRTPTPAHP